LTVSVLLLTLGVLCGLYEAAFGIRNWPWPSETPFRQRLVFAWKERKAAIIGSVLVLASVVAQVLGA